MASPRCQFVGAVCVFMLVLGIMVFVSVVLQDGTVIVPFAILLKRFSALSQNAALKYGVEQDVDNHKASLYNYLYYMYNGKD